MKRHIRCASGAPIRSEYWIAAYEFTRQVASNVCYHTVERLRNCGPVKPADFQYLCAYTHINFDKAKEKAVEG